MSDTELLALVSQAQQELPYKLAAFERLAKQQFPSMRSLAYGIVRDYDLANGIAQDALLRIMHNLPRLEVVDKYPAWSRRITVNVARTRISREIREREKQTAFAEQADLEVHPATETSSFAEMVAPLSVQDRTIVALKILEDREFGEIAEITGVGVSATKMRYYRALEKIKASHPLDD